MSSKKSISLPEPYLFFDGAFGNVVPLDKIQADPESYSSVFCEGSVELRLLLRDLWKQGIETRGCCIGHEKVHYYVKDSLFGKKQEYIDEKTYLAHAKSKRYYHIETEGHAYLAFRPGDFGKAQEICDKIEGKMKEALPELSYATNAFPDLVTISLDRYVPAKEREQFFSVLSQVLHRELLKEKGTAVKEVKTKKQPLASKMEEAKTRVVTANTERAKSQKKDRVR